MSENELTATQRAKEQTALPELQRNARAEWPLLENHSLRARQVHPATSPYSSRLGRLVDYSAEMPSDEPLETDAAWQRFDGCQCHPMKQPPAGIHRVRIDSVDR